MRVDGSWRVGDVIGAGAPSVCVNLSSDHMHDFLLYLGVLSINAGIAYLTILICKEELCAHMFGHRAHPDVPCFWRSLDVITSLSAIQFRFQLCRNLHDFYNK